MGACLNYSVSLVSETCIECGVEFAWPSDLRQQRMKNKKAFYCPNGHSQGWFGPNKTEQELSEAKARLAAAERDAAFKAEQIKTLERKAKRQTRRIHAGVCPHCNRTFEQLARHMKAKHADLVEPPK
jgi:uncharacterized protein with PIN domain